MTERRIAAEPLVSIVIPCYEMGGRGAECLAVAFDSILCQTYPAFEVVVADHSLDAEVEQVCDAWGVRLPVRYLRNERRRGSSSANANAAIDHSFGALVKILCQDDYLLHPHAIARIVETFDPNAAWHVSAYRETHDRRRFTRTIVPRLNADIALTNTIGTHSCLTIRAVVAERFDEDLIWFMDCEYYRRLYDAHGSPAMLGEPAVAQLLWPGQVTHTAARSRKLRRVEAQLVGSRHPTPIRDMPYASRIARIRAVMRRSRSPK